MSLVYYISVDLNGNQIHRFSNYLELQSYRVVNGIGFIAFTLSADHLAVADITHLTKISLWRKDSSIFWYLENFGFILSRRWTFDPVRGRILSCIAVHPNWILSTRHVAWKAGIVNRSKFTAVKAETIAKTLVTYNVTGAALASAGRIRDGIYTAWGINVQADAAHGPVIDHYCAYYNLLESLQKLAIIGVGDFDMVPYVAGYEFRWYDLQLGTDRSTTTLFSVDRGNMANPIYNLDNRAEQTIALVGGQGEGANRNVVVRQGSGYTITNDVEKFLYATHIVTTAGLQAEGDRYLLNHKSVNSFSFDVLQTYSTQYGLHYFLGDRVTIRNPFTLVSTIAKVSAVLITLQPDKPDKIEITLTDNPRCSYVVIINPPTPQYPNV